MRRRKLQHVGKGWMTDDDDEEYDDKKKFKLKENDSQEEESIRRRRSTTFKLKNNDSQEENVTTTTMCDENDSQESIGTRVANVNLSGFQQDDIKKPSLKKKLLFQGLVCFLVGFSKKEFAALSQTLKKNGATISSDSSSPCSYVICNASKVGLDEICVSGTPVTSHWMHGSIKARKLLEPYHYIWYQPPKKRWILPLSYKDSWDENHLKFPCSSHNTFGNHVPKWPYIVSLLSTPSFTVPHLLHSLQEITNKRRSNFSSLLEYIKNLPDEERTYLLDTLLPEMAKLAIDLPDICQNPIPLLRQSESRTVTLNQLQIASLLANSFFCTFPGHSNSPRQNFPTLHMDGLFSKTSKEDQVIRIEKFHTIFHYFKRVCAEQRGTLVKGKVSYIRICLDTSDLGLESSQKSLVDITLHSKGTIEDNGLGMLQVDFANKYVGGGVLHNGCVQEEIRFLINTELIVSCFITEVLADNEALVIVGAERYAIYKGYGDSFQFNGNYVDTTGRDAKYRRMTRIVAMDARNYYRNFKLQFQNIEIEREIFKAIAAFSSSSSRIQDDQQNTLLPIATGNWGCGAFRGDVELKFLIQWLASSFCGRNLNYFTYNNVELANRINKVYQWTREKQWKIQDLYHFLINLSSYLGNYQTTSVFQTLMMIKSKQQLPTNVISSSKETIQVTISQGNQRRITSYFSSTNTN